MSERRTREQQGQIIAERLQQLRELQSGNAKEEKALLLAQAALSETPRSLTHCELMLEYTTVSLMVERVACSECGATSMGYEEAWKFCPVCGSHVVRVEREVSPH